jgi:hypothetical protein
MNILIIDDKPEQIAAAVKAVEAKGWHAYPFNPLQSSKGGWIEMVEGADAVLTDLFWVPGSTKAKTAPSGLLVVIHALVHNKPVVVCTSACDEDENGHHGEAVGWLWDGYRRNSRLTDKSFGWVETKDWEEACRCLEERLPK